MFYCVIVGVYSRVRPSDRQTRDSALTFAHLHINTFPLCRAKELLPLDNKKGLCALLMAENNQNSNNYANDIHSFRIAFHVLLRRP